MNQIYKSLKLLLIIVSVFPTGATYAKSYKEETVSVRQDGQSFQVYARHTLAEGGTLDKYSIRNLFDNNKLTAWVTKIDQSDYDSPIGTFEIKFDQPVYVQSITFKNGYQKTKGLYFANQRVKDLIVFKIMSKKSAPVEADLSLKDTMASQRFSTHQMWGESYHLFKTKKIIFIIDSIYPGSHYTDLCLSGITINVSKRINYSPAMSWKDLRALIEQNKTNTFHGGWDWDGFNSSTNYPHSFNDFLYYVLTGHKDAYRLFQTYDPKSVARSEDMNNYFKGAVEESLTIQGQKNHGKK